MASQPPPRPFHRRIYDLRAYVKSASEPTLPAAPPAIPRTDYAPKRPSRLRQVWNQDDVDTPDCSSSSEASWDYKSISGLSADTDSDTSLSVSSNQPPEPKPTSPQEMYAKERLERYLSQQTHVHRHVAPPPGFSKADRGRGGLAEFLQDVPTSPSRSDGRSYPEAQEYERFTADLLSTRNGGRYPESPGYRQFTTRDVPRSLPQTNGGSYPGSQGYGQLTTQDEPTSLPRMNGGHYAGSRGYGRLPIQRASPSFLMNNDRDYIGTQGYDRFAALDYSYEVRPIPLDEGPYSNGVPGSSSNGHRQPWSPQHSQSNGSPSMLNGEASRIPRHVAPARRSSSNHQPPRGSNHYTTP